MKKAVIILGTLCILSILFVPAKAGVQKYILGEDVRLYGRLMMDEGFNFHSLHSPFQMEVHNEKKDSSFFSQRVNYPYGKSFEMVSPQGNPEKYVAARLRDSLDKQYKKGVLSFFMDYDNSSEAVRKYANPQTKEDIIETNLHAIGTASPEARKYGFNESIQIGVIEEENITLAHQRLSKTLFELEKYGYEMNSYEVKEVQFSSQEEVRNALVNPEVLGEMRYVEIQLYVHTEYTDIETETYPVLVPLWLLLGFLLLNRAVRFLQTRNLNFFEKYNLTSIKTLITTMIILLILMYFLYKAWLWILLTITILLFLICVYLVSRYISFKKPKIPQWNIWENIKKFFKYLLSLFYRLVIGIVFTVIQIINWLLETFRKIKHRFLTCWNFLNSCWKRTVTIMSVMIVILILSHII